MACPTCDHTMQNLGADDRRIFWCPRCGTIRDQTAIHFERYYESVPAFWTRLHVSHISHHIENGVLNLKELPR